MTLHRLAALGATTAAGVALLAAPAAAGADHAAAKHHPARTKVISSCTKVKYEPKSYVLACADANAALKRVSYSKWGVHRASGRAIYVFNTCTPTCVAGTEKKKAATFTLKDVQTVDGQALFTKIVVHYGTHTRHFSLPTSTI
jgi:hypothetical protein